MYNSYNASTFYVSQECGDARYSGLTMEPDSNGNGPLPSIEQALGKVKELRRGGMKQPVSVQVMDEFYVLEDTLRIDECVSAVTVEPFGEKTVTISGGKRISGFKKSVFQGTECFAAFIPEVKEGKWSFTDLYVDGKRADLTRYPETGFLIPQEVERDGGGLFDGSKWFVPKKGDLPEDIYCPENMLVSFTHYWIDEHTPVESYDPATGKMVLKYQSRFAVTTQPGNKATMEYYLENLAEQFHKPNQWYLDRPNGMLYYVPHDSSQEPDNINVFAPVLTTLVSVKGGNSPVQGVRLRNLTFAYSRGDYSSPALANPGEPLGECGVGAASAVS